MKQFLQIARAPLLFLLVCAVPLGLAAAVGASPPTAAWLHAPGWSRARVVGATSLEGRTPLALDDGGGVYLVLTQAARGTEAVRVVALDRQAGVVWEHAFEPQAGDVTGPQLAWDGGSLAVLWLNDARLHLARLDRAGGVVSLPAVISAGTRVASFDVALADGGGSVWYAGAGATPGIFAARLAEADAPVRVAEAGRQPSARYDAGGALHAVWLAGAGEDATIAYAAFPDGAPHDAAPLTLAPIALQGRSAAIDGPWLGLDRGHGYVAWTTRLQGGRNAGQHFTQHVAFPLGRPEEVGEPRPMFVPATSRLEYVPDPAAGLGGGGRVTLDSAAGAAPSSIAANPVDAPELALAAEVDLPYRAAGLTTQVGALYLRDGAPSGYQLLTLGQRSAFAPAIVSNDAGALYATWREVRGSGSAVYFASTAPDLVAALAVLDGDDYARMANDAVFGMLAGVILSPFSAFLWLAPALLALLPTWFVRRRDTVLTQWGTALSLALAVGVFWAAKLAFVRAALGAVPFAAWVPVIPPWLGLPLQVGVPLLITLGAAWAAYGFTYRRGRPSAALFVLIYGGVDGLLTMAVYGERLFGQ